MFKRIVHIGMMGYIIGDIMQKLDIAIKRCAGVLNANDAFTQGIFD